MKKIISILLFPTAIFAGIPPHISDMLCHNCDFCTEEYKSGDPLIISDLLYKCDAKEESRRRLKKIDQNKTAPQPPPEDLIDEIEENPMTDFLEEIDALKRVNEDLRKKIQELKQEIKSKEEDFTHLQSEMESLQLISNGVPFNGWAYEPKNLKWVYVSNKILPYIYSEELGWILFQNTEEGTIYYIFETKNWTNFNKKNKNNEK